LKEIGLNIDFLIRGSSLMFSLGLKLTPLTKQQSSP
jgi:hypothetical protein